MTLYISWEIQGPLCCLLSACRLQQSNLVAGDPGATRRQWTTDKAFSPRLVEPDTFCLSALNGRSLLPAVEGGPTASIQHAQLTRSGPLQHTGKKHTTLSWHKTRCSTTAGLRSSAVLAHPPLSCLWRTRTSITATWRYIWALTLELLLMLTQWDDDWIAELTPSTSSASSTRVSLISILMTRGLQGAT